MGGVLQWRAYDCAGEVGGGMGDGEVVSLRRGDADEVGGDEGGNVDGKRQRMKSGT